MHTYVITDRITEERTSLVAPNRNAALNAYVKRRLIVTRIPKPEDERWKRIDKQSTKAAQSDPALDPIQSVQEMLDETIT